MVWSPREVSTRARLIITYMSTLANSFFYILCINQSIFTYSWIICIFHYITLNYSNICVPTWNRPATDLRWPVFKNFQIGKLPAQPYSSHQKHRLRKTPQPMFNFISCRLSASCGYSHYISLAQLQLSQCSLNYKLLTINSCLENIKTCNKILIWDDKWWHDLDDRVVTASSLYYKTLLESSCCDGTCCCIVLNLYAPEESDTTCCNYIWICLLYTSPSPRD